MHSSKKSLLIVLSILVLILFCFATSSADVVYKQKATTSGFMGMGNTQTESITMLKGDKLKDESTTKFTGPMAKFMPKGGEQKQINITRLDKELIWNIDMAEKTYTEISFGEMKMMMKEFKPEEMEEPEEEIEAKVQLDVEKSGQKKKIGGYECEEFIIKMITEGKDPQTGKTGKFELHTHLWVSPDVKGYDQIEEFHKKMAEKMGFKEEYGMNAMQGLNQYGVETEELAKKMKEIKGFPMLTVMKMKTFGEEMTEAEEEEKAEQQEAMEMAMKMMGKKTGEAEEPEEEGVLMTITTEITEIHIKGVDDSEFELPEGLKKKETQMPIR
jgi:hypothetical protein